MSVFKGIMNPVENLDWTENYNYNYNCNYFGIAYENFALFYELNMKNSRETKGTMLR